MLNISTWKSGLDSSGLCLGRVEDCQYYADGHWIP